MHTVESSYEPPQVERELSQADLHREAHYAGVSGSLIAVA